MQPLSRRIATRLARHIAKVDAFEPMGKQSKQRKRSLGRAKLALRQIIDQTARYYNDTRMVNICVAGRSGLVKR